MLISEHNRGDEAMELNNFWKSISILLKNYHAINKKIFACKIEGVHRVINGISSINSGDVQVKNEHGTLNINRSTDSELELCHSSEDDVIESLIRVDSKSSCEGYIVLFKFLTKSDEDNVSALGIVDLKNVQYTCLFQCNVFEDFRICLDSGNLVIHLLTNHRSDPEPDRWGDFVLKPKLINWSNSVKNENIFPSLHLIDIEAYNDLYKLLKAKYSKEIINIWTENTDPIKFVHEDLAIAAYLIRLWKENHCEPEAFADLGCGNGLLVYILNREGYKGYGYDVRSRKIWNLYPKTTLLLEETISPKDFKVPPEVDWLIGNHSDELSPWVPVMATLASFRMKYFLLPCCAFEFSGIKFQRRNSKLSSYNDFLNYVEMISSKCGFITQRDRLKIPSTKRIALVGITRNYVQANHRIVCGEVEEFLANEMQENPMKFRVKEEAVRNCTQIDKDLLTHLVQKIFFYLLGEVHGASEAEWNRGHKKTIKDVAQYLSQDDLKGIKAECGGLKTLFKNKHEIFEILPGGNIQIRCPKPRNPDETRQLTTKKRACFFFSTHPDGCPLSDSECTFIHEK